MNNYREVMQSFEFNKILRAFWSYEATTPEESETLQYCRTVKHSNIIEKNIFRQNNLVY